MREYFYTSGQTLFSQSNIVNRIIIIIILSVKINLYKKNNDCEKNNFVKTLA